MKEEKYDVYGLWKSWKSYFISYEEFDKAIREIPIEVRMKQAKKIFNELDNRPQLTP